MAGSVILSIAYDIEVQPENDPFIAISQEVVHAAAVALIPYTFWVVSYSSNTWHKHSIHEQDFFPWLKYIPAWFPGAGFRRKARKWSAEVRQMVERPYAVAKKKFVCYCQLEKWALLCSEQKEGKSLNPSFVSQSLEKLKDELTVKDVAAAMYAAGSDTVRAFQMSIGGY